VKRLLADTTPLRHPDFRRLWWAGIPTVVGANLTIFAAPVQLHALTQSSADVGLAGVFGLVPLVVFGPLVVPTFVRYGVDGADIPDGDASHFRS
jgi:hypothetical protein